MPSIRHHHAQGPALIGTAAGMAQKTSAVDGMQAMALLKTNACPGCHAVDSKRIGPSFHDITEKYKGDDKGVGKLIMKIRDGGGEVWGVIPMPPHPDLDRADAEQMIEWILAGAPGEK